MSSIAERGAAKMVQIVPSELLPLMLVELYSRSGMHRHNEGDVLILKANSLGFGIRPVAIVKGYEISDDTKEGVYVVEMNSDRDEDIMKGRVTKEERHYKWDIDVLFTQVPKEMTPDQALSFYGGRKANWGKG